MYIFFLTYFPDFFLHIFHTIFSIYFPCYFFLHIFNTIFSYIFFILFFLHIFQAIFFYIFFTLFIFSIGDFILPSPVRQYFGLRIFLSLFFFLFLWHKHIPNTLFFPTHFHTISAVFCSFFLFFPRLLVGTFGLKDFFCSFSLLFFFFFLPGETHSNPPIDVVLLPHGFSFIYKDRRPKK